MKKIKVIIIEDEKNGQEALAALIDMYCPKIEIVGYADSIASAVKAINQSLPDLIFLDIMLGNENAFNLLELLNPIDLHIIFTTSLDCYAIDAFKANAIDYLLKPINPSRLIEAVNKSSILFDLEKNKSQFTNLLASLKEDKISRICIPTKGQGTSILDVKDIIYIEGSGTYSTFHLTNERKIVASKNLGFYYSILDKKCFYRSHQSFIVNINFITRIDAANGIIVLKNNAQISLTRNRKNVLMEMLG